MKTLVYVCNSCVYRGEDPSNGKTEVGSTFQYKDCFFDVEEVVIRKNKSGITQSIFGVPVPVEPILFHVEYNMDKSL